MTSVTHYKPLQVALVVGARPNFVKVMPVWREMHRYPSIFSPSIVHTGQHYDTLMSDLFFSELGLPDPDAYLAVGSGSHAGQTAAVMTAFDAYLTQNPVDLVVVFGDVNSTLAAALVAAKRDIPTVHVEAGLRSFERSMPEEINRVLTDHLCDILFPSFPEARRNLRREGIPAERIGPAGNVMIDTLCAMLPAIQRCPILQKLHLQEHGYAILTMHRPQTVDSPDILDAIIAAATEIAQTIPVVFPVHPRTRNHIRTYDCCADTQFRLIQPLGYIEFVRLCSGARMVITDSGGIQEETSWLGVPCLTIRDRTERPVTITHGTNRLVGSDPSRIIQEAQRVLAGETSNTRRIRRLWDGKAAARIVHHVRSMYETGCLEARQTGRG